MNRSDRLLRRLAIGAFTLVLLALVANLQPEGASAHSVKSVESVRSVVEKPKVPFVLGSKVPATTVRKTTSTTKKTSKKASTTKPGRIASRSSPPIKPATSLTSVVPNPNAGAIGLGAAPIEVVVGGNPGANVPATGGGSGPLAGEQIPTSTTSTTAPGATSTGPTSITSITSTTLAPFPAAANLPLRATAAGITPYYGLGTWIDAFDWTIQKGGKTPKVSAQTIDSMAAAGVQTVFIQASRFDSADVAEPERLIPIVNRAHELGLYVVVWYLPTFVDVNADLRRTVAIASLDVDGLSIDIEARNVANVTDRNNRLLLYSQSLRGLLPGRFVSNNIVQPNILEAVPNLWPTEYGKPPAVPTSYWTPFPYVAIAPNYDLWMIQDYWTQRSTGGGWRDAYRISIDNAVRLRAILGNPDLPLYLIGGVGDRPLTTNDLASWLRAHAEVRSVGASFYDWLVTPQAWWPALWSTRYVGPGQIPDPRFVPILPPAYVAPVQPILLPPAPTTSTTVPAGTVPPTDVVPVVVSTISPTTISPTTVPAPV